MLNRALAAGQPVAVAVVRAWADRVRALKRGHDPPAAFSVLPPPGSRCSASTAGFPPSSDRAASSLAASAPTPGRCRAGALAAVHPAPPFGIAGDLQAPSFVAGANLDGWYASSLRQNLASG